MLATIIITLILCFVFWFCCFLSTGGDDKNIKSYATYPKEVKEYVLQNKSLKDKIANSNALVSPNPVKTFLSNAILFLIVLFLLGLIVKTDKFSINFLRVLIMGQGLNLFDYLIIDLLWWRNTKRIRFKGTEDKPEMYKNPHAHTVSFFKGIVMFLAVAALDALVLTIL